ncbi:FAD-dependent oxidoreductase [Paraburkholderia lacunae]|uniref:Thioredoxin reductase n=1 Tax=Paraburkholderia lacunae TaxID=2211104 RepID=A0A370MXH5_9BURK|nr:FAD-dependent oxidoreductase [Paraburkholderia lacunae]RDJ98081.1 thioredoxin reductase [Paraburkholderia lacunae]
MSTPDLPADAAMPSELEIPYSSLEYRQHQMFPRLSAAEIQSLRRFATPMSFKAGELIFETGQVALGLFVLLKGRVRIYSRDSFGRSTLVTEHDDGHFMAEMAQLSGKPALIDGVALTDVDTLVTDPERLRALIVADAQLGEHIMRALILRRLGLIEQGLGPIIVGNSDDARLVSLQGFLRRNAYPATVVDARSDPEAVTLLGGMTTGPDDFPLVFCPNGYVLRAPDEAQLASCLGLLPTFEPSHVYDVAIVGAGPAGLAASVYAATEGLSVAVFDQRAPGGQAGASSRIENYLGFPTGISGQALAARAFQQALKFGAHLAIPGKVIDVSRQDGVFRLTLLDGQHISALAVVVASGAAYRKPRVPGFDRFEGRGTYYWASTIEAKLVKGQDIVLIGGGNSAGQAIVFLANSARSIRVLIRGKDLSASMSKYLIDRIGSLPNVTLCTGCTLRSLDGDEAGLTHIHVRREGDDGDEVVASRHLFLFIGAAPKTDWLRSSGVELDNRGFVVTGFARHEHGSPGAGVVYPLETSVPGMFAVGDARSESAKRVASAVGDGAAVVSQIHAYLSHLRTTSAQHD